MRQSDVLAASSDLNVDCVLLETERTSDVTSGTDDPRSKTSKAMISIMKNTKSILLALVIAWPALKLTTAPLRAQSGSKGSETKVAVVFTGGYQTDRPDAGRPVVLIAAALGVPSDGFRNAFSSVRPARGGNAPVPG